MYNDLYLTNIGMVLFVAVLCIFIQKFFKKYLEIQKGQKFADEYRALSEQILVEKYAPFHSDEHIEELLKSIVRIYSQIRQ